MTEDLKKNLRYLFSYNDKNCIMFSGDLRHPGQPRFLPFFINKRNEIINELNKGTLFYADENKITIRIAKPPNTQLGSPYLTHFGVKWVQTYSDIVGKVEGGFFTFNGSKEISSNTSHPYIGIRTDEDPGLKFDPNGIFNSKLVRKDNNKVKEYLQSTNFNDGLDNYIELTVELDLNTQYYIQAYSLCKNSLWNDPAVAGDSKNFNVSSKDNPFADTSGIGSATNKIGLSPKNQIVVTTGSVAPTDNPKIYASESEININPNQVLILELFVDLEQEIEYL